MRSQRLALVPLLVLVGAASAWSEAALPNPAISAHQREERELPALPPAERLELPPRPPMTPATQVAVGTAPDDVAVQPAPPVSAGWAVLRLVGATVAVAGLLLLSVAGYRWLSRPHARASGAQRKSGGRRGIRWLFRWAPAAAMDTDRVEVVSRSFLGPRESICVIRVGRERFLVGVSPAGVGLLSRLDGPDRAPAAEAQPRASDFARELRRVTVVRGAEPARTSLRPPTPVPGTRSDTEVPARTSLRPPTLVPGTRSDTDQHAAIGQAVARSRERVLQIARASVAGGGARRG